MFSVHKTKSGNTCVHGQLDNSYNYVKAYFHGDELFNRLYQKEQLTFYQLKIMVDLRQAFRIIYKDPTLGNPS